MAHIRPNNEKLKAFANPIIIITKNAGNNAVGVFPYAAIPAGKLNPPLPTIFFNKFDISSPMEANPPSPFCHTSDDSKIQFGLNLDFSCCSSNNKSAFSNSSILAYEVDDGLRDMLLLSELLIVLSLLLTLLLLPEP